MFLYYLRAFLDFTSLSVQDFQLSSHLDTRGSHHHINPTIMHLDKYLCFVFVNFEKRNPVR